MLAHFAGNVGKNIALTRKIDTKHCPWQHLRHRPFHHDLCFLWHAIRNIVRNDASLNLPVAIHPRLAALQIVPVGTSRSDMATSYLVDLSGYLAATRFVNTRRAPGVSTTRRFVDVLLPS